MSQAWALERDALAIVAASLRGEPDAAGRWPWAAAAPGTLLAAGAGSRGEVAIVNLKGLLLPDGGGLLAALGGTSLRAFRSQLLQYDRNPTVRAILIDVDSPGGATVGVTETAAVLASLSKPTVAVASGYAASAAYWIASAARRMVAAPSALVGSIGVYLVHVDDSTLRERIGLRTTYISAGRYKAEDRGPLSESARAALQGIVDYQYELFVADVARGRGVSPANVRNGFGEGRLVVPREAVRLGMVDRVGAEEAVRALAGGTLVSGALAGLDAKPKRSSWGVDATTLRLRLQLLED